MGGGPGGGQMRAAAGRPATVRRLRRRASRPSADRPARTARVDRSYTSRYDSKAAEKQGGVAQPGQSSGFISRVSVVQIHPPLFWGQRLTTTHHKRIGRLVPQLVRSWLTTTSPTRWMMPAHPTILRCRLIPTGNASQPLGRSSRQRCDGYCGQRRSGGRCWGCEPLASLTVGVRNVFISELFRLMIPSWCD